MNISASTIGPTNKTETTESLEALPTKSLALPFREMTDLQSICMGFRLPHVTMENANGHPQGVASGAGCGSPWIMLSWGDRHAGVLALDLLAAWVETWDPEEAARIRQASIGIDKAELAKMQELRAKAAQPSIPDDEEDDDAE